MPDRDILGELFATLIERRGADPASSYTAQLYARGLDVILKKVGEEAAETVIAAKNGEPAELVHEIADLWFHTLVLAASRDIPLQAILDELARRSGRSGLDEKASRGTTQS